MPKKKAKTITAAKTLKRDIKKAASSIPDLIMGDIEKPRVQIEIHPPHPHRNLVWVGAALMSLLVFGMWLVNAKQLFQSVKITPPSGNSIVGSAFNDFQQVLDSVDSKDARAAESAAAAEKIKNVLQIQFALAATIQSASSTINTTSTAQTSTTTLTE